MWEKKIIWLSDLMCAWNSRTLLKCANLFKAKAFVILEAHLPILKFVLNEKVIIAIFYIPIQKPYCYGQKNKIESNERQKK